jgi:topoisomerase-4 subunit B
VHHLSDIKTGRLFYRGDSASGSITKSRDVNTQAVLVYVVSPWTLTDDKKIVYENEEFNLLQAALDIEDDMENVTQYCRNRCRCWWNASIIIDYFFSFSFPELIKEGHLYIANAIV